MVEINKVRSLSIWIFIVPFVAVNTCLILITQFHGLFPNQEDIIHNKIGSQEYLRKINKLDRESITKTITRFLNE